MEMNATWMQISVTLSVGIITFVLTYHIRQVDLYYLHQGSLANPRSDICR
jgi:hypothetical protein